MVQNWYEQIFKPVAMMVFAGAVCGATTAFANNVSVRVEANTFILRGDAAANEVVISQNANGNLVVSGRNGTRVNGRNSFTSARSFNHVEVFMGAGDDKVQMQSINVPGNLEINLGSGNNRLLGDSASGVVGGNFCVYGGNQRDEVYMNSWAIAGNADIDLFNGISVVNIQSTGVGGFLDVYGGDQTDTVTLSGLIVGRDIDVESYAAQDVVNIVDTSARSLDLLMGGGNDRIELREVSLTVDLDVISGGGDDSVAIEVVTAERDVDVLLGGGNDLLAVSSLTAFRELLLNGQAGNQDTLLDGGFEGLLESTVIGFEIRE